MPLTDFFARIEALVTLLKASSSDAAVLLPGEVRLASFGANGENGLDIPRKIRTELTARSAEFNLSTRW
ncbi:MAG: hypothetical protein ACSHYC_16480 [Alphaproteobacteria bacterium]